MCGICGVAGVGGAPHEIEALVRGMCATIVRRGPDSDGVCQRGGVGLGIRRLKVIDLATGDQPISNERGDVHVVCNGEIYNYRELRAELVAAGHRFRTKSDVEVIVHLYEELGVECVKRLTGMFAFALYDERTDTLLLARDRLGIKPVYYSWNGGRLSFGSTVDAVVADPAVPRDIDLQALSYYFSLLYIPQPHSVYQHVRKLPPGHTLTLRRGELRISRYWSIEDVVRRETARPDVEEELRDLLRTVVRDHLVADVPLGVFLSGGLDSASVVATMAGLDLPAIKTFSVGFTEESFNELPGARLVADRFGTDHTETILHADIVDVVDRVVANLDEPLGDASAVPTYLVSQVARERVTVALSGDGGDELLAGYDRYKRHRMREAFHALPGPVRGAARALAHSGPGSLGARARRFIDRSALPFPRSYYSDAVNVDDALKRRVVAPEIVHAADPFGLFARLERPIGTLDNMMLMDLELYLPDDILAKVDRMSMAHSLEVRVPLLDHRFVEFCYALPADLKMPRFAGKQVLRRAMREALPAETLSGAKRGFGMPISRWFRRELREPLEDLLGDSQTRERGWVDTRGMRAALAEHVAGRADHTNLLWSVFIAELWARRVAGRAPVAAVASRG